MKKPSAALLLAIFLGLLAFGCAGQKNAGSAQPPIIENPTVKQAENGSISYYDIIAKLRETPDWSWCGLAKGADAAACYSYAGLTIDAGACKDAAAQDAKDACFGAIAIFSGIEGLCSRVLDNGAKNACIVQLALAKELLKNMGGQQPDPISNEFDLS